MQTHKKAGEFKTARLLVVHAFGDGNLASKPLKLSQIIILTSLKPSIEATGS